MEINIKLIYQQKSINSKNIYQIFFFSVRSSMSMSQKIDYLIENDYNLTSKFQFLARVGEGCFGHIFKVVNKQKNEISALKLEIHDKKDGKRSTLLNEIQILKKIGEEKGVPSIRSTGKWDYGYYVEIPLLKNSLNEERQKEFSISQICSMFKELLLILKRIHSHGVIHQDLKPQNIMRDEHQNLYIIDYGLSFLQNVPKGKEKKRGFIGTPRYASLAAHKGLPQRSKDDIESLMYLLAFLYMKKLPWERISVPKQKKLDQIKKIKEFTSHEFFKKVGQTFFYVHQYLNELKDEEEVDYQYIINMLSLPHNSHHSKPSSPIRNGKRRQTQNQFKNFHDAPLIVINKVQKEDTSRQMHSSIGFSERAQDGYMEILQTLTQKILFEKLPEEIEGFATLSMDEEPKISNVEKYFQNMHFKNPFFDK